MRSPDNPDSMGSNENTLYFGVVLFCIIFLSIIILVLGVKHGRDFLKVVGVVGLAAAGIPMFAMIIREFYGEDTEETEDAKPVPTQKKVGVKHKPSFHVDKIVEGHNQITSVQHITINNAVSLGFKIGIGLWLAALVIGFISFLLLGGVLGGILTALMRELPNFL